MWSTSNLQSQTTLGKYLHASPSPDYDVLQHFLFLHFFLFILCLFWRHTTLYYIYKTWVQPLTVTERGYPSKQWVDGPNFLQLNAEKTEVINFGPKNRMLEVSVQLESMNLETADQARNVDCVVDLHFNSHLKTNTKSAYYHINNIASMKKFLSKKKREEKKEKGVGKKKPWYYHVLGPKYISELLVGYEASYP